MNKQTNKQHVRYQKNAPKQLRIEQIKREWVEAPLYRIAAWHHISLYSNTPPVAVFP